MRERLYRHRQSLLRLFTSAIHKIFELYRFLGVPAHKSSRIFTFGLDDHLGKIVLRGREVSGADESEKCASVEQ